jgi:peptidoglycan/LPS O-acetylase OafA/YrhL
MSLGISYVCDFPALPWISSRELWGNIFMLQDMTSIKPGVRVEVFNDNGPLWSLSYEWWFYLMFYPIYSRVTARCQLALVGAISLLGLISYVLLPNQISLFCSTLSSGGQAWNSPARIATGSAPLSTLNAIPSACWPHLAFC